MPARSLNAACARPEPARRRSSHAPARRPTLPSRAAATPSRHGRPLPPGPSIPHRPSSRSRSVYPETVITSTPASTIGMTTATFAFRSSSAGATFACRLALVGSPAPAFKKCPSPVTYVQLSDGVWKFEVQSTSTHGLTDPTPATYQFRIDTTPPTVAAPAAPTHPGRRTATARWNARRAGELVGKRHLQSHPPRCCTRSSSAPARRPASLGAFADIPTLQNMQGTTSAPRADRARWPRSPAARAGREPTRRRRRGARR